MSVLDIVTGQLPASKSHAARRWAFVPTSEPTKPGLGTLTIVQGKRDLDSYGIDVEAGEVLFCKLDAAADVYGVACDRAGRPVKCTCDGFHFKRTCKHCDAAKELIREGLIAAR
ncbi:hypothetical protein [Limnoglobus roseus]|uniref:SWIM-type domain-containing protein n=1 Tax=Limnoglobus roseus TaxID=2598579 RepID=A0A5C1A780_9BACT|nr:hypothetical protein [Limnoglobus roseus]QEL14047.1 hypothetical protein PX52LOC_00910 [Limnoglobus roseus]